MPRFRIAPFILLALLLLGGGVCRAGIVVKVRASNPFDEPMETQVKALLPAGVMPEHVTENPEEMEVRFDEDKDRYYVFKEVTLEPNQSVLYQVTVDDIWNIDSELLDELQNRATTAAEKLSDTEYAEVAARLAERVEENIRRIRRDQDLNQLGTVSPERHITAYHTNKIMLQYVDEDVADLEDYLHRKGSSLMIDRTPKTMPPSLGTIWKVIFILIGFVGVVSLVSFLIWSGQLRKIRDTQNFEDQ
mgnify:CR=1 FL=1